MGGLPHQRHQLRHTPRLIETPAKQRLSNMNNIKRDARHLAGCALAWALALMCCLPPMVQAQKPAATPSSDCGCTTPYRTYERVATTEQQQLFEAARRADVDAFLRLLPLSGPLGDVAIQNEPILSAIIRPDPELKTTEGSWGWTKPKERARLFQAHRATWPVRLRMLRAALAQGAQPNDLTYESQQPALHLAIAFGSPEMVETLLRQGANAKQAEARHRLTPLEFLLDHEYFMRMRGLPEMLTRDERARIVASLMKAGSPEPRQVNWTELITLVSGDRWLKHLLATQKPTTEELMSSRPDVLPTAAAAYLGDEPALRTLLARMPRHEPARYQPEKNPPFDLQLDAAIAAIHGGHTKLARRLLEQGMNWTQSGPRGGNDMGSYLRPPINTNLTALEAAADQGHLAVARQLLAWRAPIELSLLQAAQQDDEAMVRLLMRHGANPMENPPGRYLEHTPIQWAIQRSPKLLPAMLAQPTVATRQALRDKAPDLLRDALQRPEGGAESRRPLVDALLQAGISGPALPPHVMRWAITAGDRGVVEALHAARAPWPPEAVADAMTTGQLDFIEQVSRLSGQPLSGSCPRSYDNLIHLVRQPPPFADRLLAQGLQTGPCGQAGPLSHRLLRAWGAPNSRPLMGTRHQRAQALLQRLWQADPDQRELPPSLLSEPIDRHRPDLLTLALSAQPASEATLGQLARTALDSRNPEALRVLRAHGLTGDTALPGGQTLAWHLGCDKPAAWRPLAGFDDLPAVSCPAQTAKTPTPAEVALAQSLPGLYYLSGVREVGSTLKLGTDGRYTNSTSYGAVDQFIQGHWRVEGDEIVLQSEDALPEPPFRILKARHEPGVQGVDIRASSGGRLMQGFVVIPVGSELSFIGKLKPRSDDGWTNFGGSSPPMGRLEGLAMAVAQEEGLRWGLMPLGPDAQGRLPNRIEVEVNLKALTPPSRETRLRLDKGDLVSVNNEFGRSRYERADPD